MGNSKKTAEQMNLPVVLKLAKQQSNQSESGFASDNPIELNRVRYSEYHQNSNKRSYEGFYKSISRLLK